jgi:hypothetical protein
MIWGTVTVCVVGAWAMLSLIGGDRARRLGEMQARLRAEAEAAARAQAEAQSARERVISVG